VKANDIILHVGDIIYDDTLRDVGVLLEVFDSRREYDGFPDSNVRVWRTWWCRAGEETYSEHGLQQLIVMDVFVCYSVESK
jgi:hypothetical protein